MGQCTTTEHPALEEAATSEQVGFSLGSCTTTQHVALEEVATGEGVQMKGLATKRKSSGEREALNMFPAKETASTIPLPMPTAATGSRKLLERISVEPMAVDLFSEDAELRNRVKETLLTFPESKALIGEQLEEAIDRMLKESKPESASVAAPGMVRLQDFKIRFYLFLLKMPTVDDILGVDAGRVFPPEWIQKRKEYLDEQCQAKNKKPDQQLFLVDKIRIDLLTKGYVEVQKEYVQSDSDDEEDSDDDGALCPYDTYDGEARGGVVLLI
jgi:hypothetical protein